jgi:hypothetical protein
MTTTFTSGLAGSASSAGSVNCFQQYIRLLSPLS